MYEFISYSEQDTIDFAQKIATKLNKNDIITLSGDLGAGKTKFTEGILKYFDLQQEISSPTFTIVNKYEKNNIIIYHLDLYRLNNIEEFLNIGGEEYLNNGICIIEWAEIIQNILPKDHIRIEFNKNSNNDNMRKIIIHSPNRNLFN